MSVSFLLPANGEELLPAGSRERSPQRDVDLADLFIGAQLDNS
jgi:hypothetical protein